VSTPPHPARPNRWPSAIAAAFGLFGLGTAVLVGLCLWHGVDLVSADYYDRELRYQEQLERMARTRALGSGLEVTYDLDADAIRIRLPSRGQDPPPTGVIHLYRPASAQEDRRLTLDLDPTGRQTLDARALKPGLWRVRLTWSLAGQEYYDDQKVHIRRHGA